MSDERQNLLSEIASLDQAITALAALPDARTPLEAQLVEKRKLLAAIKAQTHTIGIVGDVFGGDKVLGDKVLGDKIVQIIYGPDPTEEQREQLLRFLRRLAAKMKRLPLAGLAPRLDDGEGVALPQVYVMLATQSKKDIYSGLAEHLGHWFKNGDLSGEVNENHHPNHVLPHKAVVDASWWPTDVNTSPATHWHTLYRALLATEALHDQRRLVLLGDPGGGKSTFLRHLAWALAQRGLGQQESATALFGWDDATTNLPLFLPLRTLAGRLATDGVKPATVFATLRDELVNNYTVRDADTLLEHALDNGAALLLLDGLDEVPLESTPDVADRMTTLKAVRVFAEELHTTARVLVTCRVRAFDEPLRACLGWQVETLAPFTLGQMRYFVAAWYDELLRRGSLDREQAGKQRNEITAALTDPQRPRLREMGQTPLLLTMMALVRAEKGELPRDRALLYERILEQLLGAWDQGHGGQSLAQVVGDDRVQADTLRPLFDQLCYQAHLGATSKDGRGRLASDALQMALIKFFKQIKVSGAAEAADRCIEYFHERSGLLLPEDQSDTFAFAHLTLQEHGAGRHMLLGSHGNAVQMVMQHRGEDRWREPIALGLGVIHTTQPSAADRIERILTELIDPDEHGRQKDRMRWCRDLFLAADLGAERDWDLLRPLGINIDRLQRDLRRGLITFLSDNTQPQLLVSERIHAGQKLGKLGDPRFPVELNQWRDELARRSKVFGKPNGYWCYMPKGFYQIGGWGKGIPSAKIYLPPFWIARLPITVTQYAPFVAVVHGKKFWTKNGWKWKHARTKQSLWNDARFTQRNQPVVSVTWYEVAAYCAWLSAQLGAALPEGYELRLPTEAEWEAAAAFDGMGHRMYPWGDQYGPTPDLAIYDAAKLDAAAPVGCCPAGAAACGTLDMAGNVWEWTASRHSDYPEGSNIEDKGFTDYQPEVPLRGGSYYQDSTSIRCGARNWVHPVGRGDDVGFRVVVAPRRVR